MPYMGHFLHFSVFFYFFQLLFLHFSIANLVDITITDPPHSLCTNNTIYEANSPFQNNLKNLMFPLPSNASVSKLYNASTGYDPERVYVQYMCLNYVTSESCSICICAASKDIMQLCPYNKEAVVWEELCQLRYSNQNFLGQLDVSGNIPRRNLKSISNLSRFRTVLNQILSNLIKQAAFDPRANMYATGEAALTHTDMLYALVQCSTDLSAKDCETCLQVAMANLSSCCYSSRGARLLSRSCYLRYELYAFYKGANESSQDQNTEKINRSKIWKIIIPTVASALVIITLLGFFAYLLAMKNGHQKGKKETISQEFQLNNLCGLSNTTSQHQKFQGNSGPNSWESGFMDLASLYAATDNFSDSNMLGQGGFGPVYKGILNDGKEVAIKRLSSCSEQGTEEFTNEVLLIMKLQHKNLVKLLGFCIDGEEKLVVYEFMPNSSLDGILFDPKKRAQLGWSTRINIINGIAKGILYLHEDSRLRIIHRDLKASNVLLDNDMNPKISDFGMARIFAGSEGEANTARIVGTYGYMAPEYAMEGLYSTKSDAFSFGVLLLEIITGRRSTGFHKSNSAPGLLAYAWQLWSQGNELELMDPLLTDSCCSDEFSRYMHIGLLCVQEDFYYRPTMSSVVLMLKSEIVTLPQPERPAFFVARLTEHCEANPNNCSANGLTVSDVFPR